MKDSQKRQQEREDKILAFIKVFADKHNYPPSTREVVEGTGVKINSAHRAIHRLLAKGKLDQVSGKARTLVVRDGAA